MIANVSKLIKIFSLITIKIPKDCFANNKQVCPSFDSLAVTKALSGINLEKKGLISLHIQVAVHHRGTAKI